MYLALYRKYRPVTFDDVISQEHITTTLKNQVSTGQIAHAYLFTGTRGTGKTSCAKIMAKAVNCLSPKNGSPCGECAACKAVEEGSTDIIEIDAASNNGVDNIRQIRDEVIYTPIDCKYKVYIIDEVHMLSAGAFNALLKTLEEPPSHVIFILATTEYYKVPATILSRCQQFLFSKIDPQQSAKRLLEIAQKEEISLDPSAAKLIARLSDGAMRDALSLLDQCVSVSRRIDEELVRQCSGAAESEYLFAVSRAAADKNPAAALKVLDGLIEEGRDISRFIEELTAHYRNLMLEKTVGEELIRASDSELSQYRIQCGDYSLEEIMRHIDLISDSLDNINRMKQTGQARLLAEQLLIRLTSPKLACDVSSLISRIGALENRLENLSLEKAVFAGENNALNNEGEKAEGEEKNASDSEEKAEYLSRKTDRAYSSYESLSENTKPDIKEKGGTAKNSAPAREEQASPSGRSEIGAEHIPSYDDIPLPPPPPAEEAFEGGYDGFAQEPAQADSLNGGKGENPAGKTSSKAPGEKKQAETGTAYEKKKSDKNEQNVKSDQAEPNAEKTKAQTKSGYPIPETDFILPQNANPLPQWQEIISGMGARVRALLKSSQAYLYDGKIYISAAASSESVLKDGAKAEALRQRAREVLGGETEILVLKEAPPPQSEDGDLITPFLNKAKALGINVTVK